MAYPRFGGAGATGTWRRRTGRSSGRSFGFRRRGGRGRSVGGTIHLPLGWTATYADNSAEDTAFIFSTVLVWPAHWWDRQWHEAQQEYFHEGHNSAIRIVNAYLNWRAWSTTRVEEGSDVQLFCPGFFAVRLANVFDTGGPETPGDPTNLGVDPAQNLFMRDWGRMEWAVPSTGDRTLPGPVNRSRILHRQHYLTDFSDIGLGGATGMNQPNYRFRLRPFTIRANQALVLDVGAYNTFSGLANASHGGILSGTFGYRRIRSARE